ncbi:TolC family protein [Deinococcus cellulosilyticus]|uniref:Outer membrane efflux protein n=1 Tax=Deinococcus cellulosilyticus (strain DSM 18568 / NBRC 106333 / KACC 11606 / 5516J-15) TaxID=1223518 RepID=A0A511N6I2_DEIC1|nr:TolC family protein [Deinococcus cellulosilyticus]GEM48011.1 hypothetical protein DC3_36460 [Deinococcus cellulosilyticus NBRC 106333 = KACC 11606]
MYRWTSILTLALLGAAHATSLPELLSLVEQQPTVRVAQLQIQEMQLKLTAPGVLPNVLLKGDVGYSKNQLTGSPDWSGDVGASVQYGLVTSNQQKTLIELELQKLQADLILTRIQSLKSLLDTEHLYRKTQLALQMAELDLRAQQLELKTRQARFALGAVTEGQVKNTELLVTRAEVSVKQQQVALRKAVSELQRLKLNLPDNLPELPLPPEDHAALSSDLLKNRKDLQELQVNAFKLNLANFPQLTLEGSYSNGSNALMGSLDQHLDAVLDYTYNFNPVNPQENWSIRLAAKFPLDFTRGSQQQINQQQQQVVKDNMNLLQSQMQRNKADALEQYRQNQELLLLSRQVVQLSQDALEQEKYRLAQGLVSEASVLQVQKELLKEQQNVMELEKTQLDLGLQVWEVYTWYPQNGK